MGMFPSVERNVYHVGDVIKIPLDSTGNKAYHNRSIINSTGSTLTVIFDLPQTIGSDVTGVTIETDLTTRISGDLLSDKAQKITGLSLVSGFCYPIGPNQVILTYTYTAIKNMDNTASSWTNGRKGIITTLGDVAANSYFRLKFT